MKILGQALGHTHIVLIWLPILMEYLAGIGHYYLLMMRLKKIGRSFMPAGMLPKIILLFPVESIILEVQVKKLIMMMIQPMVLGGIMQLTV